MTWAQVRTIVLILALTVVAHYGIKAGWRLAWYLLG